MIFADLLRICQFQIYIPEACNSNESIQAPVYNKAAGSSVREIPLDKDHTNVRRYERIPKPTKDEIFSIKIAKNITLLILAQNTQCKIISLIIG